MDDLGQVLRDLNGKAISHRVYYRNDDDGRELPPIRLTPAQLAEV